MQRFAIVTALAAAANAYSVTIENNCGADAYIWSCGDSVGDMQTLASGGTPWTQDYYSKSGGSAGPSIYVSNGTSYESGYISQLEYYFDGSKVWFDISLINGSPFSDKAVVLGSDLTNIPYSACEPVVCSGAGPCNEAYNTHEQLAGTHDCPASNLKMTLCGSGSGSSSHAVESPAVESPAASATLASPKLVASPTTHAAKVAATATAPETTPAPAGNAMLESTNGDVHVVYAKKVVTMVVSVEAKDKRDEHVYAHQARAHSNSRAFGRRHAHEH